MPTCPLHPREPLPCMKCRAAHEEDDMPKWIVLGDLGYQGGGIMSRRTPALGEEQKP